MLNLVKDNNMEETKAIITITKVLKKIEDKITKLKIIIYRIILIKDIIGDKNKQQNQSQKGNTVNK